VITNLIDPESGPRWRIKIKTFKKKGGEGTNNYVPDNLNNKNLTVYHTALNREDVEKL
jgi:hypothetical protein